MNKKPTAST